MTITVKSEYGYTKISIDERPFEASDLASVRYYLVRMVIDSEERSKIIVDSEEIICSYLDYLKRTFETTFTDHGKEQYYDEYGCDYRSYNHSERSYSFSKERPVDIHFTIYQNDNLLSEETMHLLIKRCEDYPFNPNEKNDVRDSYSLWDYEVEEQRKTFNEIRRLGCKDQTILSLTTKPGRMILTQPESRAIFLSWLIDMIDNLIL